MKIKKSNKLVINKATVANLDEETMTLVRGGDDDPVTDSTLRTFTCYSECWTTPLWTC